MIFKGRSQTCLLNHSFDNFDPVAHTSGTFFMYTILNIAQELDDNVALLKSSVIMVSVTTASKVSR